MSNKKETIKVQERYDRVAKIYDFFEGWIEKRLFAKFRKDMLGSLQGDILEIGVGTGKNLSYYNPKAKVTAVDISPRMIDRAIGRAECIDLNVTFYCMDAQKLEFPHELFDYVVDTFVLCSVPDPVKTLKEMKRVLKKNGRIILIEHVLSKNKAIALWEHIHNPLTRRVFGFNVNRDTRRNIEKAKLTINKDEHLALSDVFRKFTCSRKGKTI
jgi:ubiquinone/menaquinone biosynthesis C-methylase UbiE